MLELIGAPDRCLARIGSIPWTEMTMGLDFARRQGVQKSGVVTKTLFATDCIERQRVNLEAQGLAGLAGDLQQRVIRKHLPYLGRRGTLIWRRGRHCH